MTGGERLARDLDTKVNGELARVGVLHRTFYRAKSEHSINEKILAKGYSREGERLMQDLLGLRVTLYFADDIPIVCSILRSLFGKPCDETIDTPDRETFKPSRVNLVFSLPAKLRREMEFLVRGRPIDLSFEVQVRTVLAEGWHEVEHDLRYKVPEDWNECPDLGRALNGVVATLETCDWSMLQLFDELAYRHYRANKWGSMVRHKFRMRFTSRELSSALAEELSRRPDVAKRIFRVDRGMFLRSILIHSISIPLTLDNVVYAANGLFVKDEELRHLTPEPIRDSLDLVRPGHT